MDNDVTEKTNSRAWETVEKIFFGLFLFSIPLQTRLTFVSQETYRYGFFNEYATFFLYLSDILFIITLFLFFVNYLTKRPNSGETLKTKLSTYPLFIPLLALFLLIIWGFLSIYWSTYKEISFYKSLKLAEFGLLFLYTAHRLRWFGLTNLLSIIFVAGFFQSIIGILQYLYQHSLGLKLLSESVLAPNIDNVAKIIAGGGEKIIRAYGTFPHPNVFAGFLVLSIFCGFWLLIFLRPNKWITVITIGTIVQLSALVMTFSRIGWLIMAFLALFLGFQLLKNSYLRQKLNYGFHLPAFLQKLFHVKQLPNYVLNKPNKSMGEEISAGRRETIFIFIFLLLMTTALWPQINSRAIDIGNKYQKSIDYRLLYNDIAIKMIKDQPLIGIGNGNFTLKMKDYSPVLLEWWQYQPAHNIYLLITSELGILGFILLLFFVFSVLKMAYLSQKIQNVSSAFAKASADPRETILLNRLILAIFAGFLFIGLFDHYFWTLQQGQLTFWLVLGLLASLPKTKAEE